MLLPDLLLAIPYEAEVTVNPRVLIADFRFCF
jgi:hypothetical protein